MYSFVFSLALLVNSATCVDIELTGDLGFTIKILDPLQENLLSRSGNDEHLNLALRLETRHDTNPRASDKPCIYQIPKTKEVDALLSTMMNQLTKIFVRSRDYVAAAAGGGWRARTPGTRFRVVAANTSHFFDKIYSRMIDRYKEFYNRVSRKLSLRTNNNPCQHQKEIKQLWKDLLDKSLSSVRHASVRCVKLYLLAELRAHDQRLQNKLGQFLLKELDKLRPNQLDTLCARFKLCYKGLL